MSKTLEQVLTEAVNDGMSRPFFVQFVIDRLRESGGLRSSPWAESASEETIARLTRERDEARNLRDQYEARMVAAENGYDEMRRDCDNARRESARLRATQSSPEVLAVVESLAEHKRQMPASFRDIKRHYPVSWEGVVAAFNAYEAAVERKAEPKPRYEVRENQVVYDSGACVTIVREGVLSHKEACDVAAVLNAADAAGRKS